jgi:hypothetical protein
MAIGDAAKPQRCTAPLIGSSRDIPGGRGIYDAFRANFFDPERREVIFALYFTDLNGTALSSTDLPRSIDPRAFDDWRMLNGDYYRKGKLEEGYTGQFNGLVTSINGIDALTGNHSPSPRRSPPLCCLLGSASLRCSDGAGPLQIKVLLRRPVTAESPIPIWTAVPRSVLRVLLQLATATRIFVPNRSARSCASLVRVDGTQT